MVFYYFSSSRYKSTLGYEFKYPVGLFSDTTTVDNVLSKFSLDGTMKLNKKRFELDLQDIEENADDLAVVFVKEKPTKIVKNPVLFGYFDGELYLYTPFNPSEEFIRDTVERMHEVEIFADVEADLGVI
jgi:hypothetical protein